jgi:hypothetical protein
VQVACLGEDAGAGGPAVRDGVFGDDVARQVEEATGGPAQADVQADEAVVGGVERDRYAWAAGVSS